MEDKMLAAVFESEGKLVLKEMPSPTITKNDDVIVRVKSCSICGTDMHVLKVPQILTNFALPNTIMGHEISGTVEKLGEGVKNLKIGDSVVLDPHEYCGNCKYCRKGLRNLCDNMVNYGINSNGGFAKYCKASEDVWHKISPDILPDLAAFTEVLADVIGGTSKVKVQPGESVAVLGGGPIGIVYMKVFKNSGASKVILSEISDYRREIARTNGADIVLNPLKENLEEIVRGETGDGVDIVVDTVGSLMEQGISIVRKGGKVVLFGVNPKFMPKINQFDITIKEIQVYGSFISSFCFPPAIELLESGVLNLEKLITHRFPLEKIHEGFKLILEGKALKVMINP
jgi:(R,R)-butanediol dehydrogenase / meso-butanediol dehydrogenase / diacetyl reductase